MHLLTHTLDLYLKNSCICNISKIILLQFSCSVMSDSLQPHGLQHTRPPCPSPTLGVHSDSCPLSQWCHPAISSSVVHFSSCPQSLPASESFPMSQLFAWGGQSTGVSALASFLPKISFRMDWLDLLAVQGTRKSLLQHHNSKASILRCSAFCSQLCMSETKFAFLPPNSAGATILILFFDSMLNTSLIWCLPLQQPFPL